MASRPTITGRGTSVAAAFVHAIIPREIDVSAQATLFAETGIQPNECVYCGQRATDMDHFRAIVKGGRPSGYFHTIYNLVPSCGPCNQSKTGQEWQSWMKGPAKGSPSTRGVADIDERIRRLVRFEEAGAKIAKVTEEVMREKAGADLWDAYWQKFEEIKLRLAEAQKDAELIRARLGRLSMAGDML